MSSGWKWRPFHDASRSSLGVPVLDRISEAVRKGDEEAFGRLISLFRFNETSNTLNQLDSNGSHPLHQAVVYRRHKMLKTILHYKNSLSLDVCITDRDGQSALDIAMKNNNHQAREKLLKHGVKCINVHVKATFEELQLGLNEYRLSPEDRETLLAGASCRSLHTLPVCRDCPSYGKRPDQRLLHPISGTHWSNDTCKMAVQKCYHDLTRFMDPIRIIPLLVESGHLHDDHVEVILSRQTQRERALQLLALLPRCGKHAYQGLFKALKEETELEVHQELLERLEHHCDILQKTSMSIYGHGDTEGSQEDLERVTTVYHGDDDAEVSSIHPGRPTSRYSGLERSLEWSGRTTESGIYSATLSGGIPGTHSSSGRLSMSGRLSTSSRRSTYDSLTRCQTRRRFSTVQELPSVLVEDKFNHEASSNFRAVDKLSPRASLKVLNTIVKPREKASVQTTSSPPLPNTNGSEGPTSLVVASTHPLPYTFIGAQLQSTHTLDESFENPMFVLSGESEKDDVERDTTAEGLRHSPVATSPPIDIPSRNDSYATLPSPSTAKSPSFIQRQISRETSSDSSASDIIRLETPSRPKDLSRVRPSASRRSLSEAVFGFFKSFRAKLNTIPDSNNTTTSSQHSTAFQHRYSYGCGVGM